MSMNPPLFEQAPPDMLKAHLVNDTVHDIKYKEVEAYEKVLDRSLVT